MTRPIHDAFLAEVRRQKTCAPLQWVAVQGLSNDGHDTPATEIAERWLSTVTAIHEHKARLIEKYALRPVEQAFTREGGGGDYPPKCGFDWTNGGTDGLPAQQLIAKAAP